ncbi:hypothetical protein [Geobacter sp. DSM 9736]|uniref:hypothetical protein n=1 Tax=Geobacter sp. DSM 9736 TaxID=1277350 RepID=UPI000B50BB60|nr:hypothetical protein [Geobacter sp. DSM 9736]SNB46547.1 hypothetical protein SAMN06269301_2015 [Geobacter sp. DSM 9736]
MPTTAVQRLKNAMKNGGDAAVLLDEALSELEDLASKVDELEEVLIMLVRTGWPWDEEGMPNELHRSSREGFPAAMKQARALLGLEHRSVITRTEPKT